MIDQPRLFPVPELPPLPPPPIRTVLETDLPGPGYNTMVLEFVLDILRRLEHDGLYPRRITFEAEIDYIDPRTWDDPPPG